MYNTRLEAESAIQAYGNFNLNGNIAMRTTWAPPKFGFKSEVGREKDYVEIPWLTLTKRVEDLRKLKSSKRGGGVVYSGCICEEPSDPDESDVVISGPVV